MALILPTRSKTYTIKSYLCPGVERNISKYINQFTPSPQNYFSLGGVMKFTNSCLLTLQMLNTNLNLVKIAPGILKKMLSHDGRRKSLEHERQATEICQLSELVGLLILQWHRQRLPKMILKIHKKSRRKMEKVHKNCFKLQDLFWQREKFFFLQIDIAIYTCNCVTFILYVAWIGRNRRILFTDFFSLLVLVKDFRIKFKFNSYVNNTM